MMEEILPVPDPVAGTGAAGSLLLADRYRLQQLLGDGGMARVYQARDELLERPVAVKVFRHDPAVPGGDLREQMEIRVLAGLSHPGLVAVFDTTVPVVGDTVSSFTTLVSVPKRSAGRDGDLEHRSVGATGRR